MARAVAEDSGAVLPVCAWVDGQYGISGVYLGVEAEIGAAGIRRVVERDLTEAELAGLRTAAEAVRAQAGRRGQPLTHLHRAGRVSAETRPADRRAGQFPLVLERDAHAAPAGVVQHAERPSGTAPRCGTRGREGIGGRHGFRGFRGVHGCRPDPSARRLQL